MTWLERSGSGREVGTMERRLNRRGAHRKKAVRRALEGSAPHAPGDAGGLLVSAPFQRGSDQNDITADPEEQLRAFTELLAQLERFAAERATLADLPFELRKRLLAACGRLSEP